MDIRAVPRRILSTNLRLARLPLNAAERVAAPKDNKALWAPTLAYDAAEGALKNTLGTVLNDPVLRQDAALQRAKVAELREAAERLATAEQERIAADAEYQAKLDQAEQQRTRAEQEAQQREAQVEQQKQEATRRVNEQTARKKAATTKAAKAREEAIDKQQTAGRLRVIKAETEALDAKQQELATRQEAERLDDAAERLKARRKA
jgi:molecular chaperone DnaK (HSP70)